MAGVISTAEAEAQILNPFRGKRGSMARPRAWFNWDDARIASKDINEFRTRLISGLHTLPESQRAAELDGLLREIDPGFADAVLSETGTLISQGHDPQSALSAALGAVLAARRKKHWWVILNEIIPFQARKVSEGIYAATPDSKERARRINRLVLLLRPANPPRFVPAEARRRLHELGLSTQEIDKALYGRRVGAHDIAAKLESLLRAGIAPVEALRRVLVIALREYAVEQFKSHPVAEGVEFCIWGAAVSAGVALIGTIVGIAVPAAQAARARRNARAAEGRQKVAPLSAGEVEQVVTGVIRSGATTWGPQQRQSALDYIRVNRFGRTAFVPPEERSLQTAFTVARNAIVAQEQAVQRAKDTKVMVGVGLGLTALVGIAVIYRRSR